MGMNSSTDGRYAAYAHNEKGLNLTAAVTAYVCDAAKEADPYATDGIAEEGITDILGASCKTAREAVKLAAKICDEKGSNESNILLFNDRKEAWYMEIYTGKGRLADYANMRTWYGHFVFSPSTAGKYYTKKKYPLFFEPDKKVASIIPSPQRGNRLNYR